MFRSRHGRTLFRRHELVVLDAVNDVLAPPARERFDAQLASFALVQRHLDGREVNCYPARRGSQVRDPALAFPNRGDDVRLATVQLRSKSGPSVSARVHLVHGFLFQIVFSKAPGILGNPGAIDVDVRLEVDPMLEGDGREAAARHLAELPTAIRAEYAELLAEHESIGGASLLPPEELYDVELPDGTFIVVAVVDGEGVIGVPVGNADETAFVFGFDGESRRFESLRAALQHAS
jgi:hypothetical protein